MFTFKKELDTTELLKWAAATTGAVVAFCIVSLSQVENDKIRLSMERAKQKKEAIENAAFYTPRLRINYTNSLNKDKSVLKIKVYFESKSNFDVLVSYPKLTLLDIDNNALSADSYNAVNLEQFKGRISRGIPFHINYIIEVSEEFLPASMRLVYEVTTDEVAAVAMREYLAHFADSEIDLIATMATSKLFKYEERVYFYNNNPIWSDFESNPR